MKNTVICSNFNSVDILPNTVDLVFTDPPYGKAGIPTYQQVAKLGQAVLKPGGFLVVYTSDYWLAETFPEMIKHLDYYYLYHKMNTRGNASIFPRRIFAGAKSILVFSKGKNKAIKWTNNVLKINDLCKSHRKDNWEQLVKDAEFFISAYCSKNGTVLDPMCGSGTTLVAAKHLGRNYIGIDISQEQCNMASKRLLEEQSSGADDTTAGPGLDEKRSNPPVIPISHPPTIT